MSWPLAQLALRRCWTRAVILGAFCAGVIVVTTLRASDAPFESGLDPSSTSRAGAWTLMLLALAPWLVYRAASTIARWRRGEIDWLASSPASRGRLMTSAWFGACLADLMALALMATVAELTAPVDREVFALHSTFATPERLVLDDSTVHRWNAEIPDVDDGSKLRLHLAFVPIESFADVELRAQRGADVQRVQRRVASRCTLDVDLPTGSGRVELSLARVAGGGIVLFDAPRLELLERGASSRSVSLFLAARFVLAFAAWSALAIGLGAWMRPSLAFGCVAALTLASHLVEADGFTRVLPWGRIDDVLELCGRGVVPAMPHWSALATTIALVVLGLALGCAGTRRWRVTP